jgi:putative toxin-antitoxin system antitoxin component (TIGR02293 family)
MSATVLSAPSSLPQEETLARSQSLAETGLYAHIVDDLRTTALTNAEVAAITGVKTRQVQHWASGAHKPQGEAKDRLLELNYVVERLKDVYRPEGIDIWLHGRNRGLGDRKPIDLLRAGAFEEVLAAVDRLRSGAM